MSTHKSRILLADDDPKLRTLVQLSLGNHFTILEASDGQEALDVARAQRPDLILLDVTMPVLNGLDVCKEIKQDPATRDIIVVMLTAKNSPDEVSRAIELGADDYITKPFSPRMLLDRLMELLS
ncbi:MAG: response regulator [Dehalococcoidia bacterium]|nr:response regulator [Dehalococcoidia bacterium]